MNAPAHQLHLRVLVDGKEKPVNVRPDQKVVDVIVDALGPSRAADAGLDVLGYASQADFLLNCGLTDILSEADASDVRRYAPLAAQANTLLSPAEMGELFKVLALGRGVAGPLAGFARGDRRGAL